MGTAPYKLMSSTPSIRASSAKATAYFFLDTGYTVRRKVYEGEYWIMKAFEQLSRKKKIGCGHTRIRSRYHLNRFFFFKFIFPIRKHGIIRIQRHLATLCPSVFAKLPMLWLIFWRESSRHPGGVTTIFAGTGCAIFWGALVRAENKFWVIIFGKITTCHKFWDVILER